jgi:hypothetical protein
VRITGAGTAAAVLVAGAVLAGCGSTGPTAAAPASPPRTSPPTTSPPTTSAPDRAELAGWIAAFCGKTQEDGEVYLRSLAPAFAATADQLTPDQLPTSAAGLASVVESGIDAPLAVAGRRLRAATPAPADRAARTTLLGVYQQLATALGAAEQQIQALPTTDVRTFVPAATTAANTAADAVTAAKTAISGDRVLGPVYAANPDCR